jgi:hypothetical protein
MQSRCPGCQNPQGDLSVTAVRAGGTSVQAGSTDCGIRGRYQQLVEQTVCLKSKPECLLYMHFISIIYCQAQPSLSPPLGCSALFPLRCSPSSKHSPLRTLCLEQQILPHRCRLAIHHWYCLLVAQTHRLAIHLVLPGLSIPGVSL